MENQRYILLIALIVISALMYFAWQAEHAEHDDAVVEERQDADDPEDDPDLADRREADPESPGVDGADPESPDEVSDESPTQQIPDREDDEGKRIRVTTDLFEIEISTDGGDIRQADLLQHYKSSDDDSPFRLMRDEGEPFFVARTGLGRDGPGRDAHYEVEKDTYHLDDTEETLEVPLIWREGDIEVRKIYTFKRDSYIVNVRHEVENKGDDEWRGFQYVELLREPDPAGATPWYVHSFTGGAMYTPADSYERISFSDMEDQDLRRDVTGGWMSMLQHYFVAVILPDQEKQYRFYTRALPGDTYLVGMSSPWLVVPGGESKSTENQLFIGPKDQSRLTAIPDIENLRLTVDYGFLTILANPLFWALDHIQNVVKNWGVAIIILTLFIKILFFKLSSISYRSMARMRKVQPKMQQIRERYADDKQQMNQALMELYKKEKINPLGGCLPMLVQIPVFIALYWVLIESVEIRHEPFILWIQDLSSRDPYFILPLLMGLSMIVQMKLNPPPMDPIQKRVMQVLPFIFTAFFMLFPAGLVLYWLSNNVLSIAQQWYIMRQYLGPEDRK
ncbi:inner membrane protein translocase component YidC [Halorhodospira halochloris]|uniref:Membrane protein insertase YidC n=1 Tax=Halorhodospira halochloris TaxID=1052 RepID=A0A110B4L8_HALHR|nr:membrane protein insertase YidC [Halorhodospira halochloris]MBK1650835.1 membrane protein insertase YidC [Halorhodospira halochloris]BAU56668.1 inner membrane protein translocase component YidC [Halorhodospira halochloris]